MRPKTLLASDVLIRWVAALALAALAASPCAWAAGAALDVTPAETHVVVAVGEPRPTGSYHVTNASPRALTVTASSSVPWLALDATAFVLSSGASADVGYSISAPGVGRHQGTVTFSADAGAGGNTVELRIAVPVDLNVVATPTDLSVSNLVVTPAQPKPGEPFTVRAALSNAGDKPADHFAVRWRVNGGVLYEGTHPPLEGRATSLDNVGVLDFKKGKPQGSYQIELSVDTDGQVSESEEANNTIVRTLTVGSANRLPRGVLYRNPTPLPFSIGGWAVDDDSGTQPISVEILANGSVRATLLANQPVPGLASSGQAPDDNHGFSVRTESLGLSPGTYTITAQGIDGQTGARSLLSGSTVVAIIAPPVPESLTPVNGSSRAGAWVDFTATYSDADGAKDIDVAKFLVSASSVDNSGPYVYVLYDQVHNEIQMVQGSFDFGITSLGTCTPGTRRSVQNAYGVMSCRASKVSASGNTLSVTWRLKFKRAFLGTWNLFLRGEKTWSERSAWVDKGTWTVRRR